MKWLAGAAAVGLALRLLFAFGYWTDQPLTRDEREYLALARGLSSGHGFTYDTEMMANQPEPFGRAPGYPAFLAAVGGGRAAASTVPASVQIAQAIVGAFGVLLIGLVAGRVAGPMGARAAAWIAACYPPLVWISAYAYSEALAWPIGLGAVWLSDRVLAGGPRDAAGARGTRAWSLAAGACTGLAILVRPATLIFLGLAVLWMLRRRGLGAALAFAIGAGAIVTPWTIRTSLREGRFVAVATEGGVTFWTGNHPLAIGEGDMAANPAIKRASLALRAQHPDASEAQMEPVYYHEALRWIGAHPLRWLALEIRKIFYLIVPIGPSYRLHSARYHAASVVSYVLVLSAAAIGWWRLGRRRTAVPALWLLAASAALTCLIFFPQERFRIPVFDPLFIVGAAALAAPRQERP